jgi:hypothetical protein
VGFALGLAISRKTHRLKSVLLKATIDCNPRKGMARTEGSRTQED